MYRGTRNQLHHEWRTARDTADVGQIADGFSEFIVIGQRLSGLLAFRLSRWCPVCLSVVYIVS